MERLTEHQVSIAVTFLAICLYMLDSYTDYILGISYLVNGDVWNGSLTLTFVLVPGFFNSIYTASLHYSNRGNFIQNLAVPSVLVYPFCLILQGQLSRLLVWIYFLNSKVVCHDITKDLVWINRDMVFYPEIFIESIPQLYYQVYVMIVLTGDYTILQLLTCFTSIMAASWGVLTLFDSFQNKFLAFEMSLLWFTSRISAIALLASFNKAAPFILLGTHIVLVLPLWFYEIKKIPFRRNSTSKLSRCQVIITDSFYAIIYAVCNTATPIVSAFYFPLSIIFFIENICCYVIAYKIGRLYNRDTNDATKTTILFKDWKYQKPFFGVCVGISVLAFLQCLLIFILKYKKVIKGNFFCSQIINLIKAIRERKESKSREKNLHIGSSFTLNAATTQTRPQSSESTST